MSRKPNRPPQGQKPPFYNYIRKQIRKHPNSSLSYVVRKTLTNHLGYAKEIREHLQDFDLRGAEKISLEGMRALPESIESYIMYAEISMRRKDYHEAAKRWRSLVSKFPHHPEGYAGEARVMAAIGDFDREEMLCRSSIARKPDEFWPYKELAEISMSQKDFPEALRRWQTVRDRFPGNSEGYVRACEAFCELKKFPDAETLCRQLIENIPNDISSYAEYAEISMRKNDFSGALSRWQTVRDKFPKKAIGYVRAAAAYCSVKDFLKAEELCRKSMEADPTDISSFLEYAEISMRKGDYREASGRWQTVRERFPHNLEGYLGGGKDSLELHDYKTAESICRKGLEVMSENPGKCRDLYYFMIDINLKQQGRAKNCLELVSNIEKTLPDPVYHKKYYDTLVNILVFMLGRDMERVDTPNTDFILLRLLKEPLNYSRTNIYLIKLISTISSYPQTCVQLIQYIQAVIQKQRLGNPLAVLMSFTASDDERKNAYLKLIREGCYHSVHLCACQPQNTKMLGSACDAIIAGKDWMSLNPYMLFDFARAVIFSEQDKADGFITTIYDAYKDRNLGVSDPIGLICDAHRKREELLRTVAASPAHNEKKKLNIAICISGQLRGYKGNLNSLIRALGLEGHNYRVFVHTWSNIGRLFPIAVQAHRTFSGDFLKAWYEAFLHRQNLKDYIKAQYPSLYSLLVKSSQATYEALKEEYGTEDIVIEDEDDERFAAWSNQEKMHYKIYAANRLALDSGEDFDLVIRIRPDLRRECAVPPDLIEIHRKSRENASVFIVNGLVSINFVNDYLIDDKFAVGIPETMNVYANSYEDFWKHVENNTYAHTKNYYGHTTIEHNLFCHGVHVDKFSRDIRGKLQEPETISVRDIYQALSRDIGARTPTEEDRRLLDACTRDLGAQVKGMVSS